MSRHRRPLLALAALGAAVVVLSGCATPTDGGSSPLSPGDAPDVLVMPAPPSGEVVAQGTVMDVAGDVELCLGPVAESYPPQCSGIPIENWSWDGVDGSDSSGDVRWGAYAVQGTYDGESFTVTQPPIMLALYDPMMQPDPTNGATGTATDERLAQIQEVLPGWLGDDYLGSYPDRGYLWVDVVWDDGTYQDGADAEFGADVVVVRSAMQEVTG